MSCDKNDNCAAAATGASSTCPYCTQTFSRGDNLRRHIKHFHNKPNHSNGLTHTANKTSYKCPSCLKDFARNGNLQRHILTVHRTSENQLRSVNTLQTLIISGISTLTDKLLMQNPRNSQVTTEQNKNASCTAKAKHTCSVCGATYSSLRDLTRHELHGHATGTAADQSGRLVSHI